MSAPVLNFNELIQLRIDIARAIENQPPRQRFIVGQSQASTRGGGLKKSVGRSKRHGQMITRPPKGGQPGYIPVRASSFWSSFS